MDGAGRRRGRRQADEDRRAERTQVFQKTKMCKFHLMGSCQRGSDCRFAHDQSELQHLPDLARTKICKQLLQTGRCDDPHCSYAHSREEYRVVAGFSAADQREAEMQLVQLEQMMRTGRLPPDARPLEPKNGQKQAAPMYQPNLLACGTPVLFVPNLPLVPHNEAFMPNSPTSDKPAIKDPPSAPQVPQPQYENAMRLQAMTQFMQSPANPGPLNGCGQPGQSQFAHGSPYQEARPPQEPANKAIGSQREVGRGNKAPGARTTMQVPGNDMQDMPFSPSEPAQIQLGSLRSLSSNSLPVQADDDEDLPDRGMPPGMGMSGLPMVQMGMGGMKVKNTFLDYDTDGTPLGNRLRPICSAAGRLDALADEEEMGGPLGAIGTVPSVISPNSAPSQLSDARPLNSLSSSLSPLSDPLRRHNLASDGLGSMFTVKNTFIECEEPPAEAALRAVHTAAGRLDMMWRDEEDFGFG